jgi:hypothetical protein
MRRGNKPEFIYTPVEVVDTAEGKRGKAKLLAVNLGSDFCAEHEWGIADMTAPFGVPQDISVYGLKRRKVTKVPEELGWINADDTQGFTNYEWYIRKPLNILRDGEFERYGTRPSLRAAWDGRHFAVISDDPADIEKLKEIFNAFKKKNGVFTFSSTMQVFENAGLCLVIANRISKETIKEWKEADKEYHEVQNEFIKTGIERLLREKGKQYFALSPKRDKKDGGLIFWLNPYHQDTTNFGWFKLADLQKWAEGRGPIPMSEAQLAERRARYKR